MKKYFKFYNDLPKKHVLHKQIEVIKLLEIDENTSSKAIEEMLFLRENSLLTSLRGGRLTDLARPILEETSSFIKSNCPNLINIIFNIESRLKSTPLFLRALKIDGPRLSTTNTTDDIYSRNIHFDAEQSSLSEWNDPIIQYYGNLGMQPRQFSIYPKTLIEILGKLQSLGYDKNILSNMPLQKVLCIYKENIFEEIKTENIPSGYLAIFDGKLFPHDGGKDPATNEPDFVMTLDNKFASHHCGYNPFEGFLE